MNLTYFYHGLTYRWHRPKAEKTYRDDHITIHHCCQAIFDCQYPQEQANYHPPRWKYIGQSDIGIITVITAEDETRIITAWRSSKAEQHERGKP